MADAIIQFPKPMSAASSVESVNGSTAEEIEKILSAELPSEEPQVYPVMLVNSIPKKLEPRIDFTTGGQRNPRWGMIISFSIIPDLSKHPNGPMMLPHSPSQFIASDNLKDIKDRVMFEIDKAIKLAELAERDPEGYATFERELYQRLAEGQATG